MRFVRRVIVIAVLLSCAATFLFAVIAIGAFLLDPFGGFAGANEFTDLSGRAAKQRISESWPPGVDTAFVQSVSHKTDWSRDSYSSWYRIRLTENAATNWMDHIHAVQERNSRTCLHHLHEGLEGVHRTIAGPPPTHWQTDDVPTWWSPPAEDFRATEVMLWYTNYDSGVGRATYSCFDKLTGTLWIYDYASQHDRLWSPGDVPFGTQFTLAANATSNAAQSPAR